MEVTLLLLISLRHRRPRRLRSTTLLLLLLLLVAHTPDASSATLDLPDCADTDLGCAVRCGCEDIHGGDAGWLRGVQELAVGVVEEAG